MPTSNEVSILSAIATALAGINGAGGGYTYDLSAGDQVYIGSASETPPRYPCAFVAFVSETVQHGQALSRVRPTMTIAVVGVATFATDAIADRTNAALNMGLDFRRAIEADLTLGGLVYDLLCKSIDDITGDDPEVMAQCAMVQVVIEVWWERVKRL